MKYNQTITFKSVPTSKDAGGALVESEATVLSDVPCIVDDASSYEKIMAEKNGHHLDKVVYCDYNSNITEGMIITWNSEDYYMTGEPRNPNNQNRHLEIGIYKHD